MSAFLTASPALHASADAGNKSPDSPTTSGRPVRAYLFKNGHAVVECDVKLDPSQHSVVLDHEVLPEAPAHGTFWIKSDCARLQLRSLVTERGSRVQERPASSIPELLQANAGSSVKLLVERGGAVAECTGVIVADAGAQQPDPAPSSMVLLDHHGAVTAYPLKNVVGVHFPSRDTISTTLRTCVEAPRMLLSYDVEAAGDDAGKGEAGDDTSSSSSFVTATLTYLTDGLTWAPSYNFILTDASTGSDAEAVGRGQVHVMAKAVVMNDRLHLGPGSRVGCIAGFPNVQMADHLDPILRTQSVQAFMRALRGASRPAPAMLMSNMMQQQQLQAPPSMSQRGPMVHTADDLHVYDLGLLELGKGERAYVPFVNQSMEYTDVYDCEVSRESFRHHSSSSSEFEDVWHAVIVLNATKVPWTTAPVMVHRNGRFVAQDTITYTAPGDEVKVRLTKTFSVTVASTEVVSSGNVDTKKVLDQDWQGIAFDGSLEVRNAQRRPVRMRLSVTLLGQLASADPEPTVDRTVSQHDLANGKKELRWDLRLEPGQTLPVKYTRVVYKR